MDLENIVLSIIQQHDTIKHHQLVREVLEAGYCDHNLSMKVHQIVKSMIHQGVICKNLDSRMISPEEIYV